MKRLSFLKIYSLVYVLTALLFGCDGSDVPKRQIAKVTAANSVFEVGSVKRDTAYTFDFYVKSEGNVPLVIDSVSTNCECTNVVFSHEPVLKGDSAKFIVTYKVNKRDSGVFTSGFMVLANIKNYFMPISFTGTIVETK